MLIDPFIQAELVAKGLPVVLFFLILSDIALCQVGWKINKPCMACRVPSDMSSVRKYVTDTFSTIASNFKAGSGIREIYASWLQIHQNSLYMNGTSKSGKKKKLTHIQLAQFLQVRLEQAFLNPTFEYNIAVDLLITHVRIAEFIVSCFSYSR